MCAIHIYTPRFSLLVDDWMDLGGEMCVNIYIQLDHRGIPVVWHCGDMSKLIMPHAAINKSTLGDVTHKRELLYLVLHYFHIRD